MLKQQPLFGGLCGPTPKYLWIYSTVIILLFGFFKELKPSEAFLNPYLITNEPAGKNFSQDTANNDIYPFWTYSYLVSALFVFLFTDFMRYNPIILIETFSYLITRILLIWGTSLLSMQLMQVVYGVATATEVGYYTYIYSAIPPKYYVLVTGPVRAAVLAGRAVSSFVGQGLFSTDVLDYYGLNYFSLAAVCVATCFSLALPWYFRCPCIKDADSQMRSIQDEEGRPIVVQTSCSDSLQDKVSTQWREFKRFYLTPSLLKWSLWWAFAMCGMLQVGNYVQSLWSEIREENSDDSKHKELNGLIEGSTDLVAALAALLASVLKINWMVWGELTMGIFSLLQSFLLFTAAGTHKIWVAYICHIIYRSSYSFMITIASSQLAISQTHESYGLVFGFNTFVALAMESLLAGIVNSWWNLGSRMQFIVYGFYYYGLTVIFVFAGVYKIGYTGLINSFRVCCKKPPSPRHDSIKKTLTLYVAEDSSSSESSDADDDVMVESVYNNRTNKELRSNVSSST